MVQPVATPPYLSITASDAAKTPPVVAINKVPTTAAVRASLSPANARLTLQQIVVTQTVHQNYTPQELLEFPPEVRAREAQMGYDENEVEFQVDGSASATVQAGHNVEFHLALGAPLPESPGIALATLTISAAGWDDTNVPIQILNQTGQIVLTPTPAQVDVLLAPGGTCTATVTIASAPSTTSLIAHVESDSAMIALESIAASGGGVIVAAGQPLAVTKGEPVTFTIQFSISATHVPDFVTGQLVINSPSWAQTKVQLTAYVGQLSVQVSPGAIDAPIAAGAEVTVALAAVVGPDTQVTFSLPAPWGVDPHSIHLGRYASQSVPVKIIPQPGTPLGPHQVDFAVKAYNGLFIQTFPLTVNVTPAIVTVTALTDRAIVPQNGSAAFQLKCIAGDVQTITLTQGPAPPPGVTMPTVSRQIGPGLDLAVPVQFFAADDALAPDDNVFPIAWATSDGVHQGEVLAPVSIQEVVQSKTFHQEITTAAALGGSVDLTIRSDGTYTFKVQMKGGGIDPYAFRITVTVWASDNSNTNFGAFCSGKVGGLVGSTLHDFAFQENGTNVFLKYTWPTARDGRLVVSTDYDDTGVLGAIEDLAAFALKWLIANAVAGPAGATVIFWLRTWPIYRRSVPASLHPRRSDRRGRRGSAARPANAVGRARGRGGRWRADQIPQASGRRNKAGQANLRRNAADRPHLGHQFVARRPRLLRAEPRRLHRHRPGRGKRGRRRSLRQPAEVERLALDADPRTHPFLANHALRLP